jgi:internalin A
MRHFLLLCLLLCLTMPLHAQDNPTPYDIALQRIQDKITYAAVWDDTILNLGGLGLTEVPPEIGQLTNLHRLELMGNEITSLPAEIFQLTNLRLLSLNDNQLIYLPSEIGLLINLQELALWGNQLTNLPPEIGQLTNLHKLLVYDNQLASLPPEIGQLTNLQVLGVGTNQLTSLPREIGQLTNLQQLDLFNNQLRHLPTEVGNLNITCEFCLTLENNPLISPPLKVVEQGTAAVLAYLRNQAWYHVQRLIVAGASGVGLLAMLLLAVRYRQSRHNAKPKRG